MTTGRKIEESDNEPVDVCDEAIERVNEFPYLGSIISANGRIDDDVDR